MGDEDAILEREAYRLCVKAGDDPRRQIWHNNGECWEPWGDAWQTFVPDARAALAKALPPNPAEDAA